MHDKTTEFSFMLKNAVHGVGVFAAHDIKADTFLRVFGDEDNPHDVSVIRKRGDVPEFFRRYCVKRGDAMGCPKDFGCMEVGWYINHSKMPNAYVRDKEFYALHDIVAGEEITIDYNTLSEPHDVREDFYAG